MKKTRRYILRRLISLRSLAENSSVWVNASITATLFLQFHSGFHLTVILRVDLHECRCSHIPVIQCYVMRTFRSPVPVHFPCSRIPIVYNPVFSASASQWCCCSEDGPLGIANGYILDMWLGDPDLIRQIELYQRRCLYGLSC
jgi:hypothetical protein